MHILCVIARYGKIYRGNRLKNCEDAGASGVVMFSDPEDYSNPEGVNSSQVARLLWLVLCRSTHTLPVSQRVGYSVALLLWVKLKQLFLMTCR